MRRISEPRHFISAKYFRISRNRRCFRVYNAGAGVSHRRGALVLAYKQAETNDAAERNLREY